MLLELLVVETVSATTLVAAVMSEGTSDRGFLETLLS